jgi:hypothetical protein
LTGSVTLLYSNMADSPNQANRGDHRPTETSTGPTPTTKAPQRTYLGQTKASWYIYWICAVASIANIFQGFDSGIYSIIISDSRFIDYFNVSGARSGVVASMGKLSLHSKVTDLTMWFSQPWKRSWESVCCLVVHCLSRTLSCFRTRYYHPSARCCIASRRPKFLYDSGGSNRRWNWDSNVSYFHI